MSIYQKEFFAATEDEAVSRAIEHFGVEKEKLEVRSLEGTVKIEGMSDRVCYVISVAGMADVQAKPGPDRDRRGGGRDRDRGGRGGGRDRDRRGGGRDRDRGGRDRGGRGDRDRSRGPRRPRGEKPEGVDHEKFEALAKDAADLVIESGESHNLGAMNSKERWVVHNYIKDVDGVTSHSEGDGDHRSVVVVLDD